jgi:hypothetical protein
VSDQSRMKTAYLSKGRLIGEAKLKVADAAMEWYHTCKRAASCYPTFARVSEAARARLIEECRELAALENGEGK